VIALTAHQQLQQPAEQPSRQRGAIASHADGHCA
jgi:hypothetical protein